MSYLYRGKITLQDYNRWFASGRMLGLMKPVDEPLIKIEIDELIESPDTTAQLIEDGRLTRGDDGQRTD